VLQSQDAKFKSVEVVCTDIEARNVIPDLYRLGARGILIYPLSVVVH
jgi:hypothetical protein